MNEPVLMVKPQFSLVPTQNRLLLEITNLHGSIAVCEVLARCRSRVEFDDKVEEQDVSVAITSLRPGTTTSLEVGGFVCNFDSFVANLGEERFNYHLEQANVGQAIQTVRERGYLKNGQPPVVTMSLSWQYKPAQPTRISSPRKRPTRYSSGVMSTASSCPLSGLRNPDDRGPNGTSPDNT
jgi:hypothetical protein